MSQRTIVAIEAQTDFDSDQVKLFAKLHKSPKSIVGSRTLHPLDFDPQQMPGWTTQDAVMTHGDTIRAALETHPAVKKALSNATGVVHGDVNPIYFYLMTGEAEMLCWETLRDGSGQFMSLDRRWPVARMADLDVELRQPRRAVELPLRFMAALSALKVKAEHEWASLKAALAHARTLQVPLKMLLLVGESELHAKIQAEIEAGQLPEVTLEFLPKFSNEFLNRVNGYKPHILHLFCHGMFSHGVSRLEFGTRVDWLTGADSGSLLVTFDDLANRAQTLVNDTLLVVLNCCDSGRASEKVFSMAHQLVANGVPAVIGMLEPVDANDASVFSRAFYPDVFATLKRAIDKTGNNQVAELEWADALQGSRQNLVQSHGDPDNNRQWSLPVLYARPDRLELDPDGHSSAESQAVAERVAGLLRNLPSDTPDKVRDELLALITHLPGALKPDRFGQFSV